MRGLCHNLKLSSQCRWDQQESANGDRKSAQERPNEQHSTTREMSAPAVEGNIARTATLNEKDYTLPDVLRDRTNFAHDTLNLELHEIFILPRVIGIFCMLHLCLCSPGRSWKRASQRRDGRRKAQRAAGALGINGDRRSGNVHNRHR